MNWENPLKKGIGINERMNWTAVILISAACVSGKAPLTSTSLWYLCNCYDGQWAIIEMELGLRCFQYFYLFVLHRWDSQILSQARIPFISGSIGMLWRLKCENCLIGIGRNTASMLP